MSLGEVEDVIKARVKSKNQHLKDSAYLVYSLGALIPLAVKGEYPMPHEVFPTIFEENVENSEPEEQEEKAQQEDWREIKKRFEKTVRERNGGI